MTWLLISVAVLIAATLFFRRLLVAILSVTLAPAGINIAIDRVGWGRIDNLVLSFSKGPLKSLRCTRLALWIAKRQPAGDEADSSGRWQINVSFSSVLLDLREATPAARKGTNKHGSRNSAGKAAWLQQGAAPYLGRLGQAVTVWASDVQLVHRATGFQCKLGQLSLASKLDDVDQLQALLQLSALELYCGVVAEAEGESVRAACKLPSVSCRTSLQLGSASTPFSIGRTDVELGSIGVSDIDLLLAAVGAAKAGHVQRQPKRRSKPAPAVHDVLPLLPKQVCIRLAGVSVDSSPTSAGRSRLHIVGSLASTEVTMGRPTRSAAGNAAASSASAARVLSLKGHIGALQLQLQATTGDPLGPAGTAAVEISVARSPLHAELLEQDAQGPGATAAAAAGYILTSGVDVHGVKLNLVQSQLQQLLAVLQHLRPVRTARPGATGSEQHQGIFDSRPTSPGDDPTPLGSPAGQTTSAVSTDAGGGPAADRTDPSRPLLTWSISAQLVNAMDVTASAASGHIVHWLALRGVKGTARGPGSSTAPLLAAADANIKPPSVAQQRGFRAAVEVAEVVLSSSPSECGAASSVGSPPVLQRVITLTAVACSIAGDGAAAAAEGAQLSITGTASQLSIDVSASVASTLAHTSACVIAALPPKANEQPRDAVVLPRWLSKQRLRILLDGGLKLCTIAICSRCFVDAQHPPPTEQAVPDGAEGDTSGTGTCPAIPAVTTLQIQNTRVSMLPHEMGKVSVSVDRLIAGLAAADATAAASQAAPTAAAAGVVRSGAASPYKLPLLDLATLQLRLIPGADSGGGTLLLKLAASKARVQANIDAVFIGLGAAADAADVALAFALELQAQRSAAGGNATATTPHHLQGSSSPPATHPPPPSSATAPLEAAARANANSLTVSPPIHRRPSTRVAFEAQLHNVDVDLAVGVAGRLGVRASEILASSSLQEAVVEQVMVLLNDKPLLLSRQLVIGKLHDAVTRQAATTGEDSPQGVSWSGPPGSSSPSPDRPHHHSRSASMESVVLHEPAPSSAQGSRWEDDAPWTSLGSRRPTAAQESGRARQQEARRAAARERCQVASWPADQPPPTVLSLDVYSERMIVTVPHDEWPGAFYLYCEMLAKATQQVLEPHLQQLQQALARVTAALATAHGTLSAAGSSGTAGKLGRSVQSGSGAGTDNETPEDQPHVGAQGATPRRRKVSSKPDFVELVLDVRQLVFSVEQHPLESWLVLHGPLLQRVAAQRQLMERLLATVAVTQPYGADSEPDSDDEASLLAASSATPDDAIPEKHEQVNAAWSQAHRDLAYTYKGRCAEIDALLENPVHHHGALMHVVADGAGGVVMIAMPGTHNDGTGVATVQRVDPPSQGVSFDKVQQISLDAGLSEITVHFGGCEQFAATVGSLAASGLLVRARQRTAPPQLRHQHFAVGRWHGADVALAVKGTRAPNKMYTDLRVEMDGVRGGYGPGLEAAFGQLSHAFKRLDLPSQITSDGHPASSSTSPTLPWWDAMRYMWRGNITARIRTLNVIMTHKMMPYDLPTEPRLQLSAATLAVTFVAGRIDLTSTHMTSVAFAQSPEAGPGEPLRTLPLFHLPLLNMSFLIATKLPGGRNPLFHHAFPVVADTTAGAAMPSTQELVDVYSMMKCEGYGLEINIAVGCSYASSTKHSSASHTGSGRSAGSSLPGSPTGKHQIAGKCFTPNSVPHAYIGEYQMAFLLEFIDMFVNTPHVVRLSRKLRSFHGHRRPGSGGSSVPLPLLQQRVDIALTADAFYIHHDAQEPQDPSDGVYMVLSSVRYANGFNYTKYKRLVHRTNGTVERFSMRQHMVKLTVEAFDVKIIQPTRPEPDPAWPTTSTGNPFTRPSSVASRRSSVDPVDRAAGGGYSGSPRAAASRAQHHHTASSGIQEDLGPAGEAATLDFGQGVIMSAACLLLKQASPDAAALAPAGTAAVPEDKRPVRIIVQDVKVLCPAELRDANIALFLHVLAAFTHMAWPSRVPSHKVRRAKGGDTTAIPAGRTEIRRSGSAAGDAVGGVDRGLSSGGGAPAGAVRTGMGEAVDLSAPSTTDSQVDDEDTLLRLILQQNARPRHLRRSVDEYSSATDDTDNDAASLADVSEGGGISDRVTVESRRATEDSVAQPASILEYEIEFVHVQVNLLSERAAGSLVLSADSALLLGHHYPAQYERVVTFNMDQVQVHVGKVDQAAARLPVHWLAITNGRLSAPDIRGSPVLHRILKPFRAHLVSSQLSSTAPPRVLARRASLSGRATGGAGGGPELRANKELRLEVPEVQASLDSEQFHLLLEVVDNIVTAPLPQVDLLPQRSLQPHPLDDNQDVQYALETLQALQENLRSLQHEVLAVRTLAASGGLTLQDGEHEGQGSAWPLAAPSMMPSFSAVSFGDGAPLSRIPSGGEPDRNIRSASEAMVVGLARKLWAGNIAPSAGLSRNTCTLVLWAEDQIHGAMDSMEASNVVLGQLRHEASLLQTRQRHSMSMLFRVDKVAWALMREGGAAAGAFVSAELGGCQYQSVRDTDFAGTTKIQVHSATFRDCSAPATDMGDVGASVLALWKPDESWAADEMLRIYCVHGALERRHAVYEHLELVVHPILVHLTGALAQGLQDYFQLRDEDSGAKPRPEELARPVVRGGGMDRSSPVAAMRRQSSVESPTAKLGGQSAGPSSAANSAWPRRAAHHRRSSSADNSSVGDLSDAMLAEVGRGGWGEDEDRSVNASAATISSRFRPSEESVPRFGGADSRHKRSRSRNTISVAPRFGETGSVIKPQRILRFKHVRFNRMIARVTYLGPPINIKEFGLVLDTRVYHNIEGSWKTIINRCKWDMIVSLIKSATGLQAQKLKQLKIPHLLGEEAVEVRGGSLRAKVRSVLGIKSGSNKAMRTSGLAPSAATAASVAEETIDSGEADGGDYVELMHDALKQRQRQHKLQLLLGNVPALPARAASVAASAAPSATVPIVLEGLASAP